MIITEGSPAIDLRALSPWDADRAVEESLGRARYNEAHGGPVASVRFYRPQVQALTLTAWASEIGSREATWELAT